VESVVGRRRRVRVWLRVLLVGSPIAVAALYLLTVRYDRGRVVDGAALRGAGLTRTRLTGTVEGVLDVVSVASVLGACAVIVLVALVRGRRLVGVAALALVLGANMTSQVLKRWVLERPDLGLPETTPATLNSMPSGHATVAFSVGLALALVLPPALRPPAVLATVGYATVVGVATLSAGWHRPSDAVAAFLVVEAWAAAAGLYLLTRSRPTEVVPRDAHRRTWRRLGLLTAYLAAFAVLVAGVLALTEISLVGTAGQVLAYFASAAAIGAAAAGLAAALLLVLHDLVPGAAEPAPA
jgi:membrane-associated phospholipid phosphatase